MSKHATPYEVIVDGTPQHGNHATQADAEHRASELRSKNPKATVEVRPQSRENAHTTVSREDPKVAEANARNVNPNTPDGDANVKPGQVSTQPPHPVTEANALPDARAGMADQAAAEHARLESDRRAQDSIATDRGARAGVNPGVNDAAARAGALGVQAAEAVHVQQAATTSDPNAPPPKVSASAGGKMRDHAGVGDPVINRPSQPPPMPGSIPTPKGFGGF